MFLKAIIIILKAFLEGRFLCKEPPKHFMRCQLIFQKSMIGRLDQRAPAKLA